MKQHRVDHLGLILMDMAGYDPGGAVEFWERMAKAKHGASPPALLSTHPADAERIENIRKLLPEENTEIPVAPPPPNALHHDP